MTSRKIKNKLCEAKQKWMKMYTQIAEKLSNILYIFKPFVLPVFVEKKTMIVKNIFVPAIFNQVSVQPYLQSFKQSRFNRLLMLLFTVC